MQVLKGILKKEQLAEIDRILAGARFQSGKDTAGDSAKAVKNNLQLPPGSDDAERVAGVVAPALARSHGYRTSAFPKLITPVMVNRHEVGMEYGLHVDNAYMKQGKGGVRTDLAATLFLSEPQSYDGGELSVHVGAMVQKIKLAAGDLFLYPANTRHRVEPVTRGVRHAAVFWIQSMIRSTERRQLVGDLDRALASMKERDPDAKELLALSNVYHSLLREWMEN
jgi:PKHD-type hydroxylase